MRGRRTDPTDQNRLLALLTLPFVFGAGFFLASAASVAEGGGRSVLLCYLR